MMICDARLLSRVRGQTVLSLAVALAVVWVAVESVSQSVNGIAQQHKESHLEESEQE